MAIDPILQALRNVELFSGLRPLQVSEIARRAERVVFKTGATIIESGREGDAAILIVSGEAIRIESPAGSQLSEVIATGTLLGEMAMLVETDYSSTVVAHGTVKALRITRSGIYEQMQSDPDFAEHLTATISRRLLSVAAELRALDERLSALDVVAAASDAPEGDPLLQKAPPRSTSLLAH